jgi:hypothetical protein
LHEEKGRSPGWPFLFLHDPQPIAPASDQNPASLTARQVKGYRVDLREIQFTHLDWPQLIGNSPFARIELEPASGERVAAEPRWTAWREFASQHSAINDPLACATSHTVANLEPPASGCVLTDKLCHPALGAAKPLTVRKEFFIVCFGFQ